MALTPETQHQAETRRDEKERALTLIGFAGGPGTSSYPMYECADCGCVVTSANTHMALHAKIAELLAR